MKLTKSFRFSPEIRVTNFYFFQSMSVGAANAFAGIWFASRGLDADEIGVINASPVLILLLISLTIGRIADRAGDWRQAIIVGSVLSAVFPFGLFIATGFWSILAFWMLSVTSQWAVITISDAASLRMSLRRGSDFGRFRAASTVGYLAVILISGYLLEEKGIEIFLPLFVGLCLLRGMASFWVPKMRAEDKAGAPKGATHLLHVMKPWFILPLLAMAVSGAANQVLNSFMGLLWSEQGISKDIIGYLIALGAIVETIMFLLFKRLLGRFSARSLILISCLTAVFRWIAMSFSPDVPVLVFLQLLHAVTYVVGFLAVINFISEWTSEEIAAEAQFFFLVLNLAAMIVAILGFGWIAEQWGAGAYLALATLPAMGAILVAVSILMKHENVASS